MTLLKKIQYEDDPVEIKKLGDSMNITKDHLHEGRARS